MTWWYGFCFLTRKGKPFSFGFNFLYLSLLPELRRVLVCYNHLSFRLNSRRSEVSVKKGPGFRRTPVLLPLPSLGCPRGLTKLKSSGVSLGPPVWCRSWKNLTPHPSGVPGAESVPSHAVGLRTARPGGRDLLFVI